MVPKKVFLSLWIQLSFKWYCAALPSDENAYSKLQTNNGVLKPVLPSDDASSFKHLMEHVIVMHSENRQLLERMDRIESENRHLIKRFSEVEAENKELMERLAYVESNNRQILEQQKRLKSDSSLYKKEIHWLKTELMIQREHNENRETLIKTLQAEVDELKHITNTTDGSSNTSFTTCLQDSLNSEKMQPILSRDPAASKGNTFVDLMDVYTGQPRYLKVQGNGGNTSRYPKFDIAKMCRHQNIVYMLNFDEPDFLRYTFAVQTYM